MKVEPSCSSFSDMNTGLEYKEMKEGENGEAIRMRDDALDS